MKSDLGKRIFIVALVVCFLALFAICARPTVVTEMFVAENRLNPTTYVEKRADGSVYIGGEGKVYMADLEWLMGQDKGIRARRETDVVVSDAVTEIGYNFFFNYSHIQNIKLGSGVTTIDHGAINKCEMLKYVYLPSSVQRLGRDFMFNCNNAFVVTDGQLSDLPALENVADDHVLTDVHSYEDFLARRAAVKDLVFTGSALHGDDGTEDNTLAPGAAKYVDGLSLAAGKYRFGFVGGGLDALTADSVELLADGKPVEARAVDITEGSVTFEATLEEWTGNVTARLVNTTAEEITVNELDVYNDNYEISPAMANWWA